MITSISRWIAIVLIGLTTGAWANAPTVRLLEVNKIWDGARHNAFTDLIRHNGTWFCVFREGSAHIPGTDGTIRVIKSVDGNKWESAALLTEKGIDLRDPKICQTPDGRLMIVMGGSVYAGEAPAPNRKRTSAWSRVSFSKDGTDWTAPEKVKGVGDNTWLWRVTWHKGVGYGAVYSTDLASGKRIMSIWTSRDGISYEKLTQPNPGINLSEYTIRFLPDDTMVILLRGEEKDRSAWIGSAAPPYANFEWVNAKLPAQGPNFIVVAPDTMLYAGRQFEGGKAQTAVGLMNRRTLTPLITLPSGGDTSYPGLVMADPQMLWVSYYSSHEGKAAIYLARIRVEQ